MTFLNAILLGGLIAGAIPIIIHIINKNRFKQVQWGAMHLLEQILRTKRRRLKLEQFLLLAVRTLIPIVLALCMARPVLTGMKSLLGKTKTSMVILFDNSYSMNAVTSMQSSYDIAKKEAVKIINSLPRGSEVTIQWLSGDDESRIGPTFDHSRARGELSIQSKGFGVADPAAAIESAASLVSKSHYVDREVILISDFQELNWNSNTVGPINRSIELHNSLPINPRISYIKVGNEFEDNIAIESVEVSRPVIGVGQKIRIYSNIKNYGKNKASEIRIFFRVDDLNRSVSQITLAPGETGQVIFSHSFETPGSHVIEVFADADSLKADNVIRYSMPVWDKLPVLLVTGDSSSRPLESETAFLEIALQPFRSAAVKLSDLIETRTITEDKLTAEMLFQNRVVVLANVGRLGDVQVKHLTDFVNQGGGLLVFPGEKIQSEWYNKTLYSLGQGLLPMEFGELIVSNDQVNPANIVSHRYEHEALEIFNDPRNGSLSGFKLEKWYKLVDRLTGSDAINVMASHDTGGAFLCEKKFGEGRVIQCSTACDDDWSNLPVKPSYLPLMQQIVTYLASTVFPPRNIEVDQQIASILTVSDAGRIAIITDPQGRRHELKCIEKGSRSIVEYDKTSRPGLYTLETPSNDIIHYIVNTSRAESELTLINQEQFTQIADKAQIQAVNSADEYLELDKQRRYGRETWKILLCVLLVLIVLEMILQQRFGRIKV